MSAPDEGAAPAAAKPKRSIFSSRPAWAIPTDNAPKTTGEADVDDDNIFSRTAQSYKEIIRDKERKKQQKAEKAQVKAEKKAKKEEVRRESVDGSARKKRRITEEDYARFGLPSPAKKQAAQEQSDSEQDVKSPSPTIRDPKPKEAVKSPEQDARPGASTITLDDSDDDGDLSIVASRPAKVAPPPPEEPDSDEELFPELVARARARRLEEDAALQARSLTPGKTGSPGLDAPQLFDPVLQILVSSDLPNTKPLLVRRKLSQRLQEVRHVWCEKQGFDAEFTSKVFLTYKNRKLYDVTTCRSLGLKISAEGRVINEEAEARRQEAKKWGQYPGNEDDPEDDGRVHVVAITEEEYEHQRREKARERAISLGIEPEGDGADAPVEAPQKVEKPVRILLKAKGFQDYKLRVKPVSLIKLYCCSFELITDMQQTTTCERIIGAFRREYKLSEDTKLTLMFDGEELEPSQEVKDTEIEDLDNLEVHVYSGRAV